MSEFFSIIITKYLFTGVIKRKSYVFSMFSGFYCRLGDLFIVESNVKLDIMDTSTCITKLLTSKTGKTGTGVQWHPFSYSRIFLTR